ncbi:MAG: PorT family protein [Bacteroidales bacterium]|nr:PorT family protein [Bacteroidales bacterium]MCF8402487.1 PorT family protein [Bacteroidales bacterium]
MSKNYKNIDDLFRDKFENFEFDPPEHVWENIKSSIAGNKGGTPSKGGSGKGLAGISLIIIVAGMFSAFLLNYDTPNRENNNQSETLTNEIIASNINSSASEAVVNPIVKSEKFADESWPTEIQEETKPAVINKSKEKKSKSKRNNSKTKNSTIHPVFENSYDSERTGKTSIATTSEPVILPVRNELPSLNNSLSLNKDLVISNEKKLINSIDPRKEFPLESYASTARIKNDYGKKPVWSFGAFFTPEIIKYPSDYNFDNRSYAVDLLVGISHNNFILQSGIGLSRVMDKGNTNIEYNKYLGNYENVYDVTFDSIQGEVVPTFYTETVKVYDTVNHTMISPTKRKFSYLNIPLLVGYGEEGKRLGWFIKGGPSLSLMVDENIPQELPSSFENRVLNADNNLPSRIHSCWQFTLSAGTTMKLGNNLKLSFEPLFRYYINSAYEQDRLSTKHPYSIGLRTGLLLDL